MEPFAALGLATSIIQIVDFSGRIISRGKEIYHSPDGTLKIHTVLKEAAKNLHELSLGLIEDISVPEVPFSKVCRTKRGEKSVAEEQLLELSAQTKEITDKIIGAIQRIEVDDVGKMWKSIDQAFRSVWSQKELESLEARLDNIRKQINTALLFSLR